MKVRVILYVMLIVLFSAAIALSVFADTVQLPRTGQTKCYNTTGTEIACAGTGQDGEIQAGVAWPEPRFSVGIGAESACVTDNLTGLMWSKNADLPNGSTTWQGALDYVASLNNSGGLCGYTDWRLPNINELESLVNAEESNSATWLTSQGLGYYWSSSSRSGLSAWGVGMVTGYVNDDLKSTYSGNLAWPVRTGQLPGAIRLPKTGQTASYYAGDDGALQKGVAWPNPRFTDNGNETVTDNLTGLTWSKNTDAPGASACTGTYKTWQRAFDYVECLNTYNYLGHNDWRLPNRKELFSLIDHSKYNPALPENNPFTNVHSSYSHYWSSTSVSGRDNAWSILMDDGSVYDGSKSYDLDYVWPVRGGQSGTITNNCAATLLGDLSIHVPVINVINQEYYWADFSYIPDTLDFTLTNAGVITDTAPYSTCAPSILSADLKLHIPVLTFGETSYWADFQYAHDLIFRLTGAGQN